MTPRLILPQNFKYLSLLIIVLLVSRVSALSTMVGLVAHIIFILVVVWLVQSDLRAISKEISAASLPKDTDKKNRTLNIVAKEIRSKKSITIFYILILNILLQDILIECLSRFH